LIVVAVMLQSFETMPILLDHWQLNGQAIAELGGHIFSQGLLLSLPVVASLLITNMALGILTKAAPQFNIFGIGFPVTISVGMVMTLLSLPSLISPVNRWLIDAQQLMLQVIR
jgi:flagellar biosynthesis protein FliR